MVLLPIRGARFQPVTIRHGINVPVYYWFGEVIQGFQSFTNCNVFKRLTLSPSHPFTISNTPTSSDSTKCEIERAFA